MTVHYRNLVVWQRADDLFIGVHQLTHQQFPRTERFELGSQLRRAAYSVPANIVEGSARQSERDRINFFNIAASSLSEVTYGLHAARRLEYMDEATFERFDKMTRTVAAPLYGLIRHERAQRLRKTARVTVLLLMVFGTPLT